MTIRNYDDWDFLKEVVQGWPPTMEWVQGRSTREEAHRWLTGKGLIKTNKGLVFPTAHGVTVFEAEDKTGVWRRKA